MHCTQCGTPGEGRFCGGCGASLVPMDCPACGHPLAQGHRFCNECGSPLRTDPRSMAPTGTQPVAGPVSPRSPDVGWWFAGALLVVLLVVGGWALLDGGSPAAPPQGMFGASGGPPGALGPAPGVDLSSMTPREAADRLYDRVMRALSARDSMEVMNFLPMAIDAYEIARPLDLDGHFHLSLLQRAGLDFEGALATAEEALERDPDHLLNLSAAASAAREMNRDEEARRYYERLIEVWDREVGRADRPEYREHEPALPEMRREAEEFTGGTPE